ncbi:MAG: hypothetical protein J3K34DRAFT_457501 [Monoraphidium minutum]|nr:MAG: hypothetical protein J3K34DRAFT_457501 [Monoraphidium minutum]
MSASCDPQDGATEPQDINAYKELLERSLADRQACTDLLDDAMERARDLEEASDELRAALAAARADAARDRDGRTAAGRALRALHAQFQDLSLALDREAARCQQLQRENAELRAALAAERGAAAEEATAVLEGAGGTGGSGGGAEAATQALTAPGAAGGGGADLGLAAPVLGSWLLATGAPFATALPAAAAALPMAQPQGAGAALDAAPCDKDQGPGAGLDSSGKRARPENEGQARRGGRRAAGV